MEKICTLLCVLIVLCLCACGTNSDVVNSTVPTSDINTSPTAQEITQENERKEEDETLTHERKLEILKHLHSLEDKIYSHESEYSDSELDTKLDEAWEETCKTFHVTEQDILNIMSDMDLVRESYK